MKEKVNVKILGLHMSLDTDDKDSIGETYAGTYMNMSGRHIIKYDSPFSEGEGVNKNLLKLSNKEAEIIIRGEKDTKLRFVPGRREKSLYKTPFGTFEIATETDCYRLIEKDDEIKVVIGYGLFFGNEKVSDAEVEIEISLQT